MDVPSKLDDFGTFFSLLLIVDKMDKAYVPPSLCFSYAPTSTNINLLLESETPCYTIIENKNFVIVIHSPKTQSMWNFVNECVFRLYSQFSVGSSI